MGIRAVFLGGDAWYWWELLRIAGASIEGSYCVSEYVPDANNPEAITFRKACGEEYYVTPTVLQCSHMTQQG